MASKSERNSILDSVLTNELLRSFWNNDASSKSERTSGTKFSDTDLMQMQWEYQLTQEERAYNEEFYNNYESPAAMVRQYQEAGLNPALMYENSGSSGYTAASNSTGAGSGTGTAEETQFSMLTSILSMLGDFSSIGSQIDLQTKQGQMFGSQSKLQNAQTENVQADTLLKLIESRMKSYDAQMQPIMNALAQDKAKAEIDKLRQDIAESVSRIDLNNMRIKVGDSEVQLNFKNVEKVDAEKALLQVQKAATALDAEKVRRCLDLYRPVMESQIALNNAQSENQMKQAEKNMWEAQVSCLKAYVDMGMIEGGYVEQLLAQERAKTKGMKIQNTMTVVNGIVSGVTDIANAAANVVSSVNPVAAAAKGVSTAFNPNYGSVDDQGYQPYSSGSPYSGSVVRY